MKLKVYQWQYDDIEAAVWDMKDGVKWLDENLEIAKRTYISNSESLPYVYVFFGLEGHMEEWRKFLGFTDYPHVDVKHAMSPNKIEGLRGIPVRVYGKDGDKTWYHQNYHEPAIQQTLTAMFRMDSYISTVERIE